MPTYQPTVAWSGAQAAKVTRLGSIATLLIVSLGWQTAALKAAAPAEFKAILNQRSLETYAAISDHVTQHPDAPDVEQAYAWLLENAVTLHIEGKAILVADAVLKRPSSEPALRTLAQQVRGLGLVQTGRIPEAMEAFSAQLGIARFRSANATIDFGLALATQCQVQEDIAAAREIYQRLADGFPLNQDIRQLAERKLARMELIGKPAPPIRAKDLEGKELDLSEYAGKVVLIDFWATNCAPCLAEFPNLKQIYAAHHARGFEILGISLDDSEATVNDFRQRNKLPWRMVLNSASTDLGQPYHVPTIPALFLVDQKGTVVLTDVKGEDLSRTVSRLLDQPQ